VTDPHPLQQRIADALRTAACPPSCELTEVECTDAHPILASALRDGTITDIGGPVTVIVDTVLTVVQPELERLRKAERTVGRSRLRPS
jgi:hypothetical protein